LARSPASVSVDLAECRELTNNLHLYPVVYFDTTQSGNPQTTGHKIAKDIPGLWEDRLAIY